MVTNINEKVENHELKVIFATELFSKLSDDMQDMVICQIKALLSHE